MGDYDEAENQTWEWLANWAELGKQPGWFPNHTVWVSSGGTQPHMRKDCLRRAVGFYPTDSTRKVGNKSRLNPVLCVNCHKWMRNEGYLALHAMHVVMNQVAWASERKIIDKVGNPTEHAARYRRCVEAALFELEPITHLDSRLAAFTHMLDDTTQPLLQDMEMQRTYFTMSSGFWNQQRDQNRGIWNPAWQRELPYDLRPRRLGYQATQVLSLNPEIVPMSLHLIADGIKSGEPYEEALQRAQVPASAFDRTVGEYGQMVSSIPDVLVFQREDFATTHEWLEAEYSHALIPVMEEIRQWIIDSLTQVGPDGGGCWVTVKMPRPKHWRPANSFNCGSWHEVTHWFPTVHTNEGTFVRLPIWVWMMLFKGTSTSWDKWEVHSDDPMGEQIVQALTSLLAASDRSETWDLYEQACAVVGADPNIVYGSPELPAVPPPHEEAE